MGSDKPKAARIPGQVKVASTARIATAMSSRLQAGRAMIMTMATCAAQRFDSTKLARTAHTIRLKRLKITTAKSSNPEEGDV